MSVVAKKESGVRVAPVPGPKKDRLTPEQARQINAAMRKVAKAEKAVDDAQVEWAKLVKTFGYTAVWRLENERDPVNAPTLEGLRKRVLRALGEL